MLLLFCVVFLLVVSFNLLVELVIGLILVVCCFGGVIFNLYIYLFKGDVVFLISLIIIVIFILLFILLIIMYFVMEMFSVLGYEF